MKNLKNQCGFTLIELTVVIVILGLLYAIAVPKFQDITGLKLRSASRQTASMIKFTYDEAVSKNKKLRIVFVFGEEEDMLKIEEWVEKGPADLLKLKGVEDEDKLTLTEKEEMEKAPRGEFAPYSDQFAKNLKLPDYVKIKGIYIAREDKTIDRNSLRALKKGAAKDEPAPEASIVFLPQGYTENAIVYLSDLKERVYSIRINPITGVTTIFDSYVEPGSI